MEGTEILKEYFLLIENNKELEENNYPEAVDLLSKIENVDLWNNLIKSLHDEEIQSFFTSQTFEIRCEIFKFGISSLVYFIQANFTGPHLSEELETLLNNLEYEGMNFASMLTVNQEEINVNTKYPILLVVAKSIFEKCLISNLVNSLWIWRSLMIHQRVLDELSPPLLAQVESLFKQTDISSLQGYEKAKFSIEFSQLFIMFRHITKTKEHISSADNILGLHYTLQGKLGKRTKYQENNIAQLTLELSLEDKETVKRPVVHDFEIPKNISLKDDVRLDSIKFAEGPSTVLHIPNTEQKLLLATVYEVLIATPQDDLQNEELQPFIECILSQKNTWAVRLATLLLRCKLEVKFQRTINRTLDQLGEILDCYKKSSPHVLNRVGDVFGTGLLPIWKVEEQYAQVLLNLGLIKESLEIYTRIQLWEEVIVCYTLLQRRNEAARVIKEQLQLKETVKMLCLLGDATDDLNCYERAWELSRRRSHRAQRHWGNFLYARKQYKECIPHFEKSVSINPLQPQVWLRLGFAGLQSENWHVAATAYRRYTSLEPDGFQAWNNLAQSFIKIGNKLSAHQALLEALKYNFENWKIWENFLVVSCDILHLSSIIRAYHKVLDLKGKYLNVEALNILVFYVRTDVPIENKKPEIRKQVDSENLLQKTKELVGRVTSVHPGEGYIWELYGWLVPPSLIRAERLQKAFKGYTQLGWEKNTQTCVEVLCLCKRLAELILTDGIDTQNTLLHSVKLNLGVAVAATKKHEDEDIKILVKEVSTSLEKLIEKIKNLDKK